MPKENDSDQKKEKPVEIIDDITQDLDQLHGDVAESAEFTGYARESYRSARKRWEDIESLPDDHPDKKSLTDASVDSLKASRDEIREIRVRASEALRKVPDIASSAYFFATSTSSSASMLDINDLYLAPPTPPPSLYSKDQVSYADRFAEFDEALGDTYRGISEVLYGTRSDPERAALLLIRHAFDQFFNRLAPDDEVLPSQFRRRKEGDKPDQIHRIERIIFAAHKHIKDHSRRDSLIASGKHMLKIYKSLNRAHDRNELDKKKAMDALRAMDGMLKVWADAVGL